MSITRYLRENACRYNDLRSLVAACAVDLSRDKKHVQNAFYDIQRSRKPIVFGEVDFEDTQRELEDMSGDGIGISEDELRKKHDVKYIIRQAAMKLKKDKYVMDNDFIKKCNLGMQTGYRQSMEDAEFTKYKGRAGRITYWSHPESIQKMKTCCVLN